MVAQNKGGSDCGLLSAAFFNFIKNCSLEFLCFYLFIFLGQLEGCKNTRFFYLSPTEMLVISHRNVGHCHRIIYYGGSYFF